jgi:predicted transposase/invertase (TIGR01784 family)
MATVYEADITDLVKPHLEKARLEGEEEGFQKGEFKKAIETARKMQEEGDSINKIIRITGLTMDQLKEHGILG